MYRPVWRAIRRRIAIDDDALPPTGVAALRWGAKLALDAAAPACLAGEKRLEVRVRRLRFRVSVSFLVARARAFRADVVRVALVQVVGAMGVRFAGRRGDFCYGAVETVAWTGGGELSG